MLDSRRQRIFLGTKRGTFRVPTATVKGLSGVSALTGDAEYMSELSPSSAEGSKRREAAYVYIHLLYRYIHICTYFHKYMCIHICVYIYTCVHIYVYVMHAYIYVYACAYKRRYTWPKHTHVHMNINIHIHLQIHVYVHRHIHVRVHRSIHLHIHTW